MAPQVLPICIVDVLRLAFAGSPQTLLSPEPAVDGKFDLRVDAIYRSCASVVLLVLCLAAHHDAHA